MDGDRPFPVGLLVAGYDEDGIGRVREVSIPGPVVEADTEVTTALGGASWRGQTDVIRRLVFGFDGDVFAPAGAHGRVRRRMGRAGAVPLIPLGVLCCPRGRREAPSLVAYCSMKSQTERSIPTVLPGRISVMRTRPKFGSSGFCSAYSLSVAATSPTLSYGPREPSSP